MTDYSTLILSGTSIIVPVDWNNADNQVHCIGGGQSGGAGTKQNGGRGARGGKYALGKNVQLIPGATVEFRIGAAGVGVFVAGGDTWFNATLAVNASVIAPGGGSSTVPRGNVIFDGGSGNADFNGGGGGAAGPNGAGAPGFGVFGGHADGGLGGQGGQIAGSAGENGSEWIQTAGIVVNGALTQAVSAGAGGGGAGLGATPGAGGSYGGGGAGGKSGGSAGANGGPGGIVLRYKPVPQLTDANIRRSSTLP